MNKRENAILLPRLRFPEFHLTGGWDRCTLEKVADRITEKVGDKQLTTFSISAGVGFVSQAEKFNRDISGKQYKNYINLKKGDFSYNKGNSKKFPQGCIYELEEYEEAAVPNAFISFRFRASYVSNFYKGYFDNNFHGKQLAKFITSGARMDGLLNICPSDFFSIVLPTPKEKEEQQKIADCLSSIDDLIHAESKKLSALKDHKKGLMQKLFPAMDRTVPEWRFSEFRHCGDWILDTIGKTCASYSGGTPATSEKEYYSGNIPFIRSGEIDKETTELCLSKEGFERSSAKMVSVGDILVALYGANSGEVALSRINGAINQAILCLKHKTNNAFVYHYLTHKKNWIIRTYIQGGQGNLSGEIIKSIELFFPSELNEQKKIADCLSSIDELISMQAEKIEALKTHKKGLLQGLFPSIEEVSE
ncbi:restriction endonuclease subunit S [Enterocloster bolteae]|uniref:restriction endonuclease subunit S n=1 Tax=Enterocloster bolteae TaxID=208479 RepID=UPI00210B5F66|nr:restriction endonuclease subunit S [Enterocloster bolteae]MCQ5144521.1 restriction endonuclease subunit S [Enterocloster bolteae]